MDSADVPREWVDVHLDQHGPRHGKCMPAACRTTADFSAYQGREHHDVLRRSYSAHQHSERAGRTSGGGASRCSTVHCRGPASRGNHRADRARAGWELTHVYGLTETSPLITFCEPRPEHQNLSLNERAQIKARQGVELVSSGELRVVDENGQEVPHDGQSLGEIVVRGNVVMEGYYNDLEATNAAIREGWFHTGDAAVLHSDGFVEIRDRFKDVIISGGENISSVEVEGCLLRHPAVQEAAVVGMPHEKWGESPHAFVILRKGAKTTEDELKLHVRHSLAHFKAPQWVTFVDELPKTATGKVQKFILRAGKAGISRQ